MIANQINLLSKIIHHHNYFYYIYNAPLISDTDYDQLFVDLTKLEKISPNLKTPNSPSQNIGTIPQNTFTEITHYQPMLSIESSTDKKLIQNFFNHLTKIGAKDTQILVQPKIDGLSIELIYKNGLLKQGSSRGDGITGEDITSNLYTITDIPKYLNDYKEPNIIVRGEIYITHTNFNQLNRNLIERNQNPFTTTRNAAASFLRQLKKINIYRPLHFFPFELVNSIELGLTTDSQVLTFLKQRGFPSIDKYIYLGNNLNFVETIYSKLAHQRDILPFEIDGIVIKINDLSLRQFIGIRSRSPRWIVAWKFHSRHKITTIRDIAIQIGRTGKLTPIALLMPVDVNGVTVSRATLHNFEQIQKLNIWIDDLVHVERAGDVIPKITKANHLNKKNKSIIVPPTNCPVCGTKITQKGVYYLCPNTLGCPAQLEAAICHYVSHHAMNIEGLGHKRITMFIKLGLLTNLPSLYSLTNAKDLLIKLAGWNKSSVINLIKAIEKSRGCSIERFIFALGIPNVGHKTALILAKHFNSIDNLTHANKKELTIIKGIGPIASMQIKSFFNHPDTIAIINQLYKQVKPKPLSISSSTSTINWKNLVNLTIFFTGALESMNRNQAKSLIYELGGQITHKISSRTKLIIIGNKPSDKINNTQILNIKVINERNFLNIIGNI